MKRLAFFFFQGLLYIAPIIVTAYVLYRLFVFFDDMIPVNTPGLGILIILVVVTIIGYVGQLFITTPFNRLFNRLLKKAPLIQVIYSSVKDLVSAFVGKEKKFNHPVLVRVSKTYDLEKMGFITSRDLDFLGHGSKKVAVYFPHSYAFSGELFFVPADQVKALDINPADAMKFIISAGVTHIDEKKGEEDKDE